MLWPSDLIFGKLQFVAAFYVRCSLHIWIHVLNIYSANNSHIKSKFSFIIPILQMFRDGTLGKLNPLRAHKQALAFRPYH